MTTPNQDWRRIIPGLIISAISIIIIFYFVDLRRMVDALRLADYRLVVIVYGITILWLGVRTIAWRTLLQEKATHSQVFYTLNEGYLLNNILPFRLGELGRAFLLGRKSDQQFLGVFSTIIIERTLDVALAVGLLLGTFPFVVGASWAYEAAIAAGVFVLFGICMLYLLARFQDRVLPFFEKLASRWSFLKKAAHSQIPAFFTGLAVLTDGKRFLKASFLIIISWGIAIVQYYTLLLAFFPDSKLLWAAFSLGVMALGIAVPSSPGAIGVMELSLVAALSLFGLDPSISLAAALTAHLTNYIVTGVIGIYALVQDGLTLTGLFKQVQEISPDGNQ